MRWRVRAPCHSYVWDVLRLTLRACRVQIDEAVGTGWPIQGKVGRGGGAAAVEGLGGEETKQPLHRRSPAANDGASPGHTPPLFDCQGRIAAPLNPSA